LAVQLGRQPGFGRYVIEVKPFVNRLARDIVSQLSKRGLEVAVEHLEVLMGRHKLK
jgi:hypothetical protein